MLPCPLKGLFLYSGRPGWLYLTVGAGAGNGTLICQLEGRDGRGFSLNLV